MKPFKIRIKQSRANKKWYFTIIAGNNQVIAQSQGYKRASGARKTVERLIECMQDAELETGGT